MRRRTNAEPFTLGVVGLASSGKTQVACFCVDMGFEWIDVDGLGHQALERARQEIIQRFGWGVIHPDGTVNRAVLGTQVFQDAGALRDLEALVHPWMRVVVKEQVAQSSKAVIDAALLYRMDLNPLCHGVLGIEGLHAQDWERVARIRAMQSDVDQAVQHDVDVRIANHGSLDVLRQNIIFWVQTLDFLSAPVDNLPGSGDK